MKKSYLHPRLGEINFVKRAGLKNIRITVSSRRTLLVSYPWFIPFKMALSFVNSKEEWILASREKQVRKKSLREFYFEDGLIVQTTLGVIKIVADPLMDSKYIIKTVRYPFTEKLSDGNNSIISEIRYNSNLQSTPQEEISHHLFKEVRRCAEHILPNRAAQMSNMYNLRYKRLFLKNNRTNWGSCSSAGNINLNINLVRLPLELMDYVIKHELCHLKIANHGVEFHKMLNIMCEGKDELFSKMLRRHSPQDNFSF